MVRYLRVGLLTLLAIGSLPVQASNELLQSRAQATSHSGECSGILHKDQDGIRFGGSAGEDEGICVIGETDVAKVLAVCSVEKFCRVKGLVDFCQQSGECVNVTHITSIHADTQPLAKAFGTRALSAIGIAEFRKWYDAAKLPKTKGGPVRIRKAHGIISMIRRLMAYGIAVEHSECARLAAVLEVSRFKQPGRRRVRLELHHVEAFIKKAIEHNRVSLALGTAIQFETILRQRDVIGEWEPIRDGETTGITLNGRRWVNGLTWADLGNNFELFKDTTKTGQTAAHDLKLFPMIANVLAHIPSNRRVGPLIVDELAQRPYAMHAYTREWREVATAAGIPKTVWNMDARAGGISEADDAGAELDDIRSTAAHSQASTTVRYIRGGMGKSRKVAQLRQAHRTAKNETET